MQLQQMNQINIIIMKNNFLINDRTIKFNIINK
jgi:hypothetical protein